MVSGKLVFFYIWAIQTNAENTTAIGKSAKLPALHKPSLSVI